MVNDTAMDPDDLKYLEYDRRTIFEEQKATLNHVFDILDTSRFAFVGGIADYLNLRGFYQMPVHDLDIIYEAEEDIKPIITQDGVTRHQCQFYRFDTEEVIVSEHFVNEKRVHIDYYRRNFHNMSLSQSPLLGKVVWHASFLEMKQFHNGIIAMLTSEKMGHRYDWKRLYKHSKKASLYNNIVFLEEKNLIHTLSTAHENGT